MRLRLTVRRHGLPETSIIWVVDSTISPTIAQLLEQVNESIPIEAGEWGFEDYAVEVKGIHGVNYECLHYQPVCKVMKEEDEVIIRPLLTQDLKVRKISGRHQISADGKHLVDGLAYGRPLLKKPADRPAINIPPRKRRRITYSEEEELEDEIDEGSEGSFTALKDVEDSDSSDAEKQLVLHADFDDDSEEDDDDFAPGDESAEEDNDSGEELGSDNERLDEAEMNWQPESNSQTQDDLTSEIDGEPLALADVPSEATRAKIRRLQSAFPKAALAVCKYTLLGTGLDMGEAYEALNRGFVAAEPKSVIVSLAGDSGGTSSLKSQPAVEQVPASDLEDSEDEEGMEDEQEDGQDSVLNFYDQNGFPPGSIVSGKLNTFAPASPKSSQSRSFSRRSPLTNNTSVRLSDDGALQGLKSTRFIDQVSSKDEESDTSDEDSIDEVDSSSDSDSSDSSEEEGPPVAEASRELSSESDSDSDSSSDSSSDEDAPEETSSKLTSAEAEKHEARQSYILKHSDLQPRNGAPGQGSAATRFRNVRRKNSQALTRYKQRGVLPKNTTIHEFVQLRDLTITTTPEEALAALEELRTGKDIIRESEPTAKSKEFERRRQELLVKLSSGGVELGNETEISLAPVANASNTEPSTLKTTNLPIGTNSFSNVSRSRKRPLDLEDAAASEQTIGVHSSPSFSAAHSPLDPLQLQAATSVGPTQGGPSRQNKLNLGAGRRLIFGALGLRAPKTETDEAKIRSDLSKLIRPEKPAREVELTAEIPLPGDDDSSWREKINYRAVECVQQGIELSEPPFPFVQRWDPQQRIPSRGGKKKKVRRDESQYYDNDLRALAKQIPHKGRHSYAEEEEYVDASYRPSHQDSFVKNYEDSSQEAKLYIDDVQGEISQQLQSSTQGNGARPELDDLPLPPEDLSLLATLEPGRAEVGMTIVFKQLECSAATKWQPQITDVRTATVIDITDSGDLQLSLAKRDRKQYEFDEETGERLFDKFDIPLDDEPSEEDNGMLSLSFSELYEPKIFQDAPADLCQDVVMQDDIRRSHNRSVSNAMEPNLGVEHQEPQFSHVTETTLQSDAPESSQQDEIPRETTALTTQGNVEGALEDDGRDELHEVPQQLPSETIDISAKDLCKPLSPAFKTLESGIRLDSVSPVLQSAEIDAEPPPETISDEARITISHIMKDAGFRSSIPSSILRDLPTNGTQSPGDDAVFEKLMRDMTEIGSNAPYSPKFNGLGSSSPIKRRDAWEAVNASQTDRSVSPALIQSNWVTIDGDMPSSPPRQSQTQQPEQPKDQDAPGWMTESGDEPASPPAVQLTKRKGSKKRIRNKVPVAKAPALWAQFQQKRENGQLNTDSEKTPLLPEEGSAEAYEKGVPRNVEYPKLSVGSSFTSQITDHGHQPDFSFGSEALNTDTHIAPEMGLETAKVNAPTFNAESATAHQNMYSAGADVASYENEKSEAEQGLPPQEIPISARIEALLNSPSKRLPVSHGDSSSSSDESFPSLQDVFSQSSAKNEPTIPVIKKILSKDDRQYQKTMAMVDEDSEGSNQSTPKQSQKHNRHLNKQVPKSTVPTYQSIKMRDSQSPASQVWEPQQSQSRLLQASMVVDLTLSSDAEPQPAGEFSDESEPSRAFKTYDPDFKEDDEDGENKGGWARKKLGSIPAIEERKKPANGLRASLQSSLNSHKRRKM